MEYICICTYIYTYIHIQFPPHTFPNQCIWKFFILYGNEWVFQNQYIGTILAAHSYTIPLKKKYMPVDGNYPLIRLPSWKWAWLWGPWQFHTHESWSSSGLLMWDKGECEWLESSPKGRTTNRNRAKKLVLAWAWSVSSPSQTNHQFRPTPASRGGI